MRGLFFVLSLTLILPLTAAKVGQNIYVVGIPQDEIVHLTPEMLITISDELMKEDIAEVDVDPEAFEVEDNKPKVYKKNGLDDIEFLSEGEPFSKLKH